MFRNFGALFVVIFLLACASPDEKANKIFIDVSQLVDEGLKQERNNYSSAFNLYRDAFSKLETITEKYPSSQLAVQITQDSLLIGNMKISEFKNQKLKQVEYLSNIMSDLSLIAEYFARKSKY